MIMAASEVVKLSSSVIQIASAIQQIGNNWYLASADWADFPRKVKTLRRKHDFWRMEFAKYGMSSDASLMETLIEAQALLKEEQIKLLQRQASCCVGCWPKVCMTMFPTMVGLSIQLAIDAFDAIPGLLQMEEEATVALEKRIMRKASSIPIGNDNRYVPLKVTEFTVLAALTNPQGPSVTLLHGGSGKGKSTLARHIALHYHQYQKSNQPAPPKPFLEEVVFLECGPHANILSKQFELVHLLGAGSTAAPQEQGHTGSNLAIPKRLLYLLKNHQVLIIFDDVWEGEFLQRMVDLCGPGVKCLVTSQRADLCKGLSFAPSRIRIEDIKEDVAMEILACHVGFPDKKIPSHIQGLAKKMIQETQGNPLALASVATAIDYGRSDELKEWEAASRNFLKLLRSEDTAHILGMRYSRSFWSAMRLSIQSLNKNAQQLLIMVHMCDGPSIPEEVLQVFYHSVVFQDSSETFEKSRKHLECQELLKITTESLEYNCHVKQRSWSVHSLQKQFIEDEMRDRKEYIFEVLAQISNDTIVECPKDEDNMVQLALCALYLEKGFAEKAATKMGVPFDNLSHLRRQAIEPVTRLLGRLVNERWTAPAQSSAKVIFLRYIYNCALHENGILHLLTFPISSIRMLNALYDIATIEETILLEENSQDLMKALVNCLGMDTNDVNVAKAAARAIGQLSQNSLHFEKILSSGILDETVRILSSATHPDLQVNASNIVAALSYASYKICDSWAIMQNPRILAVLVKSLFDEDNPGLQISATMTLGNLAGTKLKAEKLKIVHFPKALDQLISFLSKVLIPDLQIQATRALANLAVEVEETKLKVVNSSSALKELLNMFPNDNNPALQLEAARTFFTLAATKVQDTKQKLMDYPGALQQLVHIVSIGKNSQLQTFAAKTILNLSKLVFSIEHAEHARRKFDGTEGLIDGLLGLLRDQIDPITQGLAVTALTYIDPARANGEILHSAVHHSRRGYANMMLSLNKEALEDLNKADKINPGDIFTLRNRVKVRARLGDFPGALADSNSVIKEDHTPFNFQERGVLKRMTGDLPGALADLTKVLDSDPDDYESLKHRAYVRFLNKDEIGARSDAERALRFQSRSVVRPGYGRNSLGSTSVEFLDYKLTYFDIFRRLGLKLCVTYSLCRRGLVFTYLKVR